MVTGAALTLTPEEASILDGVLRYFIDTMHDPDEMDDEDREQQRKAERIRERLRKSLARHGYRLTEVL